jgi:phage gp29-like protein
MAQYVKTQNGLIIPEADYAEMHALSKKPSMMEIATIDNGRDITRGFIRDNMIMAAGDTVLSTKGGDYSLYEEIARDYQVKTCRQQRELALIAKEWGVEPGDTSRAAKKAADRLEAVLKRLAWDEKTQKMLGAVLYGYSAAEMIWATDGAEITLADIKVRNRKRFGFLPSGELRLRITSNQMAGEALPAGKFWAFSCGADDDDEPYGLGLGHYLYWPTFFKKNGLKSWLTFLDKFGQPTAVGKYPAGASDLEKSRLLQALASIQSSTAIRIPEGMIIELLEATRSGTADYTSLYDRMNAAISKVYLGHTGSTDATPGRLGGEDNAGEVREDLIKADADLVCGSFNRTAAKWLTFYNDGPDVAPPRVWRKTEPPEDLKAEADKDKTLFDMGFKPTLKYIADKYGEGYQEIPNAGAQQQPNTPQRAVNAGGPLRANTGQGDNPAQFAEAEADIDPTSTDSQTDRLAIEAGKSIKAIVDQVAAFAEQAESMEALRDKLLASYGDLDESSLTNVMTMAFAAAELSGRFDVSENG